MDPILQYVIGVPLGLALTFGCLAFAIGAFGNKNVAEPHSDKKPQNGISAGISYLIGAAVGVFILWVVLIHGLDFLDR